MSEKKVPKDKTLKKQNRRFKWLEFTEAIQMFCAMCRSLGRESGAHEKCESDVSMEVKITSRPLYKSMENRTT